MSGRPRRNNKLQCYLCQREFRRTEHLTRHERSHRNEKPFPCNHCDARFTRKDLVKTHTARHHKDAVASNEPYGAAQPPPQQPQEAATISFDGTYSQEQMSLQWTTTANGAMFDDEFNMETLYPEPDFRLLSDMTNIYAGALPGDLSRVDTAAGALSEVASSASVSSAHIPAISGAHQGWRTSFDVSNAKREEIAEAIRCVIPPLREASEVILPSCISFRRYLAAFFEIFLTSLPFIHGPTWCANDQPPGLLLAIAAIGAGTCGNLPLSFALHRVAQSCLWNHVITQLDAMIRLVAVDVLSQLHLYRFSPENQPIWVAQSLLLIMLFGTYSGRATIIKEVISYQSILASIIRSTKVPRDTWPVYQDVTEVTWEKWIQSETLVRTKFAVYIFFGQLNLVLGMPSMISKSDIEEDNLPSSEEEWHAATLEAWSRFREQGASRALQFSTALEILATEREIDMAGCSPLGGIVMLHAILQNVWHIRQSYPGTHMGLQIQALERALRRWEAMSEMGLRQGSLTNKSLPRALELDGNALLKSAYFTLYAGLRSGALGLLGENVHDIISAMKTFAESIPRTSLNTRAAIYSAQVLLMLFNSGVVWTNKIMTGACSLQFHIISSLQCCLYLSRWLGNLGSTGAACCTAEDEEVFTLTRALLIDIDIGLENLGKPMCIQLLYAWCSIFRNTGQSGLAPAFVQAVRGYADTSDMNVQEGSEDVTLAR